MDQRKGRPGRGRGVRGGGGRGRGRGRGSGRGKNGQPKPKRAETTDENATDGCDNPNNNKSSNWAIDGYHLQKNRRHNDDHNNEDNFATRNGGRPRGVDGPNNSTNNHNNNNQRNHNRHNNNKDEDDDNNNNNISRKRNGRKSTSTTTTANYPSHWKLNDCIERYNAKDPRLIRGKLRVLPGRDTKAFCTCDRGIQKKDVVIETSKDRNRAMDGDIVYVQLYEEDNSENGITANVPANKEQQSQQQVEDLPSKRKVVEESSNGAATKDDDGGDIVAEASLWQDDPIQMRLWAPTIPIRRHGSIARNTNNADAEDTQRKGHVVRIVPPKQWESEIHSTEKVPTPYRNIVGTLKRLHSGITLLTPNNPSLPQFKCSNSTISTIQQANSESNSIDEAIFCAKYIYGSWEVGHNWPPCKDLEALGMSCNVQDETRALLLTNGVDHGEFPPDVLHECEQVVASGEYTDGVHSGWKPTPDMYHGRRDYRNRRIFTIDPTTAKDLDDALHIEKLANGQVEIGVHIADVSYFVQPDSPIDIEAQRRCTTVYLVDRTVPMLPRPLCEIACSLNENVERLAYSCVWRMNLDGTVASTNDVWYGRTIIKSCARLDYATAQNIIDGKVATGESIPNEDYWPKSRQPTGGHTIDEVAADVRLMNDVAQARRRLRFQHGAIALSKVKLTFQLDGDRETPLLCAPYIIRESNRLVEEYMLLANYLVAQRLVSHVGERALLRHHEPPPSEGLEKVAAVANAAIGFNLDIRSSQGLQQSLNRLARECGDHLAIQCVTEMLKTPLKPANYIAAGEIPNDSWSHFALNIPYYTHFTSPIRRYADVIVHRLLQATIDGEYSVDRFYLETKDVAEICGNCNQKKDSSRKAQERSDEVFLALFLKRQPMKGKLGIVLSVGDKAFTVFVPSLGMSAKLYVEEHEDWLKYRSYVIKDERRIKLERTSQGNDKLWTEVEIKFFTKIRVTCACKDKPPISVKLIFEGPWVDDFNE